MRRPPSIHPVALEQSPLEMISRWPVERALMMLHSGRVHPRWARWSILTTPTATFRFDGRSSWINSHDPQRQAAGGLPEELQRVHFIHDPLADLDAVLNATALDPRGLDSSPLPFRGGWVGYLGYELGRVIEPAAIRHAPCSSKRASDAWPLMELAWCPQALIFDHVNKQWHMVGDDRQFDSIFHSAALDPRTAASGLGPLRPDIDPDHYMSMVDRTIDSIRSGDIYQANIAQRFSAALTGDPRALAAAAFAQGQPWYGAYLELASDLKSRIPSCSSLLSLSPELFLQSSPLTRRVITRPIKGTRPSSSSSRELDRSAKDAAELHMIVDLMRNDLGRVCEFGSVRVPNPRIIESHPTVHHGVAEITGQLRPDIHFSELLRATFPGGSVTGAPKIRAMQIIDELEPFPRGPYCGSIGFISDCGGACLNIAIRTMLISGNEPAPRSPGIAMPGRHEARVHYFAGAGIVADSDPLSEYRETLDKAAVLRALCARPHESAVRL